MATTITEALGGLDPANDEHWTMDGAPRLDAVEALLGRKVLRKEVIDAAPKFMRQPLAPTEEPEVATEAAPEVPEAPVDNGDDEPEADEADEDDEPEADEPQVTMSADDRPKTFNEGLSSIAGDMEKLQEVLSQGTELMLEAQRDAEGTKKRADELANQVNSINRRIEHLTRSDPNHNTAGIRAYINQQNKNRMARVAGLHRFQEMTKIDARDLAQAIDPRSPLDRAMAGRKPARGTVRPPARRM